MKRDGPRYRFQRNAASNCPPQRAGARVARSRPLSAEVRQTEKEGAIPTSEFDGAFAAMTKERVEALLVVTDAMFTLHRVHLAGLAAKNRLPSMHGMREYVEAGALMSYGPNVPDLYQRAATFVDRIFKGAKPADLPVEQPTKFELVINMKTAKALGLMIPQSVHLRADQVRE